MSFLRLNRIVDSLTYILDATAIEVQRRSQSEDAHFALRMRIIYLLTAIQVSL